MPLSVSQFGLNCFRFVIGEEYELSPVIIALIQNASGNFSLGLAYQSSQNCFGSINDS